MNKFLLESIFLIFPLILLIFVIEVLHRKIPNDYTLKHNYLIDNMDIEVLTLGNSHVLYGVDPNFIELETYNASLPAQTIKIDYNLLNNYKNNFSNLKYIVIPVDYYSFYAKIEDGNNYPLKFKYDQYMGFSLLTFKDFLRISNSLISFERPPVTVVRSIINYYRIGKTNIRCENNGFFKTEGQVDLEESGLVHSKRHNEFYAFENWKYNQDYLYEIFELAKNNNWTILLINTPCWTSYRKHLYPERLKNLEENCIRYSRENENVLFVDLFKDDSFTMDDFYDDSHVGTKGVQKLSIGVNNIIKLHQKNKISKNHISSLAEINKMIE